jgi:hypothetical protein
VGEQISIDDIDVPVSEWDAALVEQAVLHFGRGGREVSTNTFRDLLPEMAHGHIGKAIRNLARRKVIAPVPLTPEMPNIPKQVKSTSGPTHGKPVNCYVLTEEGEELAREQYERGIVPEVAA